MKHIKFIAIGLVSIPLLPIATVLFFVHLLGVMVVSMWEMDGGDEK